MAPTTLPAGRSAATDSSGTPHAPGWELSAERGPDWLFVRLDAGPETAAGPSGLTKSIWDMIREHHASRVVLELEGVERVDDSLLNAISEIGTLMLDTGGLVRVCGLPQAAEPRLQASTAAAGVPWFGSRTEAVGTRRCPEGRCE